MTGACLDLAWRGRTATLAVASAGHPPPLLLGAGGAVRVLDAPGRPLGVGPGPRPGELRLELVPGDIVVLRAGGGRAESARDGRLAEVLAGCSGRSAREVLDHVRLTLAQGRSPATEGTSFVALWVRASGGEPAGRHASGRAATGRAPVRPGRSDGPARRVSRSGRTCAAAPRVTAPAASDAAGAVTRAGRRHRRPVPSLGAGGGAGGLLVRSDRLVIVWRRAVWVRGSCRRAWFHRRRAWVGDGGTSRGGARIPTGPPRLAGTRRAGAGPGAAGGGRARRRPAAGARRTRHRQDHHAGRGGGRPGGPARCRSRGAAAAHLQPAGGHRAAGADHRAAGADHPGAAGPHVPLVRLRAAPRAGGRPRRDRAAAAVRPGAGPGGPRADRRRHRAGHRPVAGRAAPGAAHPRFRPGAARPAAARGGARGRPDRAGRLGRVPRPGRLGRGRALLRRVPRRHRAGSAGAALSAQRRTTRRS